MTVSETQLYYIMPHHTNTQNTPNTPEMSGFLLQ